MAGGAWIWNTRQYHGYEKKSGDVNAQLKLMPSANMQPNHGLPLASGLMVAPAGSLLCTEEGIVRLVIT
jgi:hypothetical protein